jgi:hypothetical protein
MNKLVRRVVQPQQSENGFPHQPVGGLPSNYSWLRRSLLKSAVVEYVSDDARAVVEKDMACKVRPDPSRTMAKGPA